MAEQKKQNRLCENGHSFTKTSDCPVCPICEAERKPKEGFLKDLSAPARRALENNSIKTLEELAQLSEKEALSFHGMGKASLPKLRAALQGSGLKFKKS